VRYARWGLLGLLLAGALAQSQSVYNFFPPPGITYSAAGGMALGSATGGACGAGCLNAQSLEINGVTVSTGSGSVTSVSVVSANGLSGSVANPTTTPAITLSPTFTGIAYSTGTALQAAIAGNFPTLNQSTTGNAATATLAAAATALAASPTLCGSGMAAGGILANGDATGCITPYSVVNENAGTFFAGPCSGTAALPTFRILCVSDLPLSSAITWTGSNTWTANNTFTGDDTRSPTSGVALTINGAPSSDALDINNGASEFTKIIGNSTTGESNGLDIIAGTNSSDTGLQITNRAGSTTFLSVLGSGQVTVANSSGPVLQIPSDGEVTIASPSSAANEGSGFYQAGYLDSPFEATSANPYTLVFTDRGKTIAIGTHNLVIPANASVAFPIGTWIRVLNIGESSPTISITSDSMVWIGTADGVGGSTRTMGNYAVVMLYKYNSTIWYIWPESGTIS